jgi:hypothetical protein
VVYSATISDTRAPTTFEEAFNGPNKECKKAIQEDLPNFSKRGGWKMVTKNQVNKNLKRKSITTQEEGSTKWKHWIWSKMCFKRINAATSRGLY